MKPNKNTFGLSKLGAAAKVVIPSIALAAPLGHASSRNTSASRSGSRLRINAVVHVSELKENSIKETSADHQRVGVTGKRSAFAAFTNSQHKKVKHADIKANNQALAFLKSNNLLNSTGHENARLSGDLVSTGGRKQFLTCTVLPSIYTTKIACTAVGHTWNSGPADTTPPVVSSIMLSGSPASNATSVNFVVSFNENANNVSTDDFSVTTASGSATGIVSAVSASSGSSVTLTVSSISGAGSVRLDLKANTNITDDSGNGNNTNGYVAAFSSGATHTVDLVAPVFQNSTPSLSATTISQSTLTTRLDEAGVSYYVVVPDGAGAPSAAQVKNGQNSSGSAAFKSGSINVSSAGSDFSANITGFTPGTAYDLYVVAEDGGSNLQASATRVDFTTNPQDSDGSLTSAAGVSEPVSLNWSVDTVGEAVDLFDMTISDGGSNDGLPMTVSQVVINVSGTSTDAERAKITWRLNGSDASNVTGVYNAGSDTITFSGLGISIADGASEAYTLNGYYNDNSGLTSGRNIILSVDGDTDLTVGGSGTLMGATSAVTNSTGTTSTDNVAPSVTSVSVPANSTYTAAANLDFTVNFNENVIVNTGGGTPRLTLLVGASTRYANYISGSPGAALIFRYTVPSGDQDLDGIGIGATVDLNSGTLRDSAGNNINTTLNSVGSLASVLVDSQAPTMAEVTPVVTPSNDNTPDVTVSATEAGTLAVGGSCGSSDEGAVGSGNNTITLTQPDNSTPLASGTYSNCTVTVTDSAGNASNVLTLTSFLVDTIAPSVTSVSVPASNTYTAGSNLDFIVNLTENVTVNTTGGTPRIAITVGGVTRYASYISGSGTAALTFRYTVLSGDTDSDGIVLGAAIDANSGTLSDSAGNNINTTLNSVGNLASVLVDGVADTTAPTVTSVSVPVNNTYTAGSNLDFIVNLTENVTVNTTGGTPRIAITVGGVTRYASYISGSGTAAVTFRYTVQSGDLDLDGIALAATIDTNSGTLRDSAGNNINITLNSVGSLASVLVDSQAPTIAELTPVVTPSNDNTPDVTVSVTEAGTLAVGGSCGSSDEGAVGSGNNTITLTQPDNSTPLASGTYSNCTVTVTDSAGNASNVLTLTSFLVDTIAPSVTSVSVPASNTYTAGSNLDFIVNLTENVTVNTTGGTPRIAITVGVVTRYASYISGSGTAVLTFRYTVQSGDADSDGIVLGAAIDTNSGTLSDSAGNNINTTLNSVGNLAPVLVDGVSPSVDTDGDGVSDAQEGIDGTNPNDPQDYLDVTAPVLTAPADIMVDAVGLFTPVTQAKLLSTDESKTPAELQSLVVVTDNIDGMGCCNASVPALSRGRLLLSPGLNNVTWRAADKKGNVAEVTQKVHVRPLVSMSKDQIIVEGALATIRIILNGRAPAYPFKVPYVVDGASTASGSDHDLVAGIATFNAGETVATISVNIAADGVTEGDEILTVALDDRTTASQDLAAGFAADIYDINSGVNAKHNLTIVEGNVAPDVRLQVQQGGIKTNQITRAGGAVTVTATSTDLNAGDTVSLDWSASDNRLVDTDGNLADLTLVFDPSSLNEGRYSAVITATDSQGAKDTATVNFVLVAALPVLSSGVDTDGDGTDDDIEGTADTDDDGVPDYLDNIAASNVLPESAMQTNSFLMESDPGLRLRLGIFAAAGASGGASLSEEDVDAQDGLINDEEYDLAGGIFDFEIHELPVPGQQVRMVVPQSSAIPEDAVYRKFHNGAWMTFVDDDNNDIHSTEGDLGYCPPPGDNSWQVGLTAGHYCVQLTIEDGGPNDADGEVNSAISDPGSVGTLNSEPVTPNPSTPTTTPPATTVVHSSGGGGSASFGLLGMLLLLGAVKNYRPRKGLLSVMVISGSLTLLLPSQESYAIDWENLSSKSFVEFEVYAAEGSQKRSDFVDDMANYGVDTAVTAYDVTRLGYQVSLGYTFNPYTTFLVGYTDLGDVDLDFETSTTDQSLLRDALGKSHPQTGDGLSIAYRYRHNLMKNISAFVDAGIFVWSSDIDTHNTGGSPKADKGTDPMVALGVDYAILEKSAIGLKYRYHRLDDQNLNGLGLLFRVSF